MGWDVFFDLLSLIGSFYFIIIIFIITIIIVIIIIIIAIKIVILNFAIFHFAWGSVSKIHEKCGAMGVHA